MSDVLRAIEWGLAEGVNVINMSLGSGGYYRYMDEAGRWALERGCLLVASAGNEGKDSIVGAPANAKWVMAVGGLDKSLRSARSSSPSGPTPQSAVDISAPGSMVWSAWKSGKYGVMAGTSVAAPHVAGAAALWTEVLADAAPVLRAALVWQQLLARARRLEEPATWVGAGCVQAPGGVEVRG
jgi:subtilisin family serine protease